MPYTNFGENCFSVQPAIMFTEGDQKHNSSTSGKHCILFALVFALSKITNSLKLVGFLRRYVVLILFISSLFVWPFYFPFLLSFLLLFLCVRARARARARMLCVCFRSWGRAHTFMPLFVARARACCVCVSEVGGGRIHSCHFLWHARCVCFRRGGGHTFMSLFEARALCVCFRSRGRVHTFMPLFVARACVCVCVLGVGRLLSCHFFTTLMFLASPIQHAIIPITQGLIVFYNGPRSRHALMTSKHCGATR